MRSKFQIYFVVRLRLPTSFAIRSELRMTMRVAASSDKEKVTVPGINIRAFDLQVQMCQMHKVKPYQNILTQSMSGTISNNAPTL